ncbi:sensor histidine kinase [Robertmurraya kyonggiensis]|uniref:histidine kinase n=1 Tax=Robertmurraya kyonggiensis TaxID=1037680 RepID=A0A4U1D4J0_9BACI|nr:HAMP domain-containing sensor histidine kinase [Robertmurraya kyonggiensis]TKC16778.1 HAMP domain-containing histidine kinase [Robertmurraya kyonggiensis]
MFKKKIFRQQQLKFMILNLLAFTVIFTIFGVIIFSQVQSTLFKKTDEELTSFKEMSANHHLDNIQNKELSPEGPPNDRPKNSNPRIMVIEWDEYGQILNIDEIGTLFYETYFQNYRLDKTNLDKITMIQINDDFNFRYILFKDTNTNDNIAYTQLLVNVDAEQTILNNFSKLIIICSVIFIILSISASYVLSKKMMQPIIHSWKKQSEFVENASHELRTPLTIIQNKLELLLTSPQEKIASKFENIALSLSETRRLSKLTSDLLTLARADSAETQLVKQTIHVDSFIRNVCTPYKEIAESQDKHFWLSLNCDVQIDADEVRLHQLLVILLDNALKYTNEHDSIGVKTYSEDQKVVLEISDTGIGVKEENSKLIFDRFYREDKARSRESGGVGLGLSIAQWIVEQHGGSIRAIPNQLKGTTFKVKIPK